YAPWSEKATQHAAELERDFAQKYRKRGLEVIGIQVIAEEDARAQARAFRTRYRLSFPLLIDPDAASLRRLGPGRGVPQVVLVDRNGQIRYAESGWNPGAVTRAVQDTLASRRRDRAAGLR